MTFPAGEARERSAAGGHHGGDNPHNALGLDGQVKEFELGAFAPHHWDAKPNATPAADSTPRKRLVLVSDADHIEFRAEMSTLYSATSTSRASRASSDDICMDEVLALVPVLWFGSAAASSLGFIRSQYEGQSGSMRGSSGAEPGGRRGR